MSDKPNPGHSRFIEMQQQMQQHLVDESRVATPLMTGGNQTMILAQQAALLQSNPYVLAALQQQQQQQQQSQPTQNQQQQYMQQLLTAAAFGRRLEDQTHVPNQVPNSNLAQLALLTQQPQMAAILAAQSPQHVNQQQQMQTLSLLYNQVALQALQNQQGTSNLTGLANIALQQMENEQNHRVAEQQATPNKDTFLHKRNSAFGSVISPQQHSTINPALLRVAENLHTSAQRRQSAPVQEGLSGSTMAQMSGGSTMAETSGLINHVIHDKHLLQPPKSQQTNITHEALQERISRLISENEAILEPPNVLLKRRSYHRHQTVSADHAQQSDSPSQKNCAAKRSHSLQLQSSVDSCGLINPHCSINNLQSSPVAHVPNPCANVNITFRCYYCSVNFPNEKYLQAHEFRSEVKDALQSRSSPLSSPGSASNSNPPSAASNASTPTSSMGSYSTSSKRYPLKKRILAAVDAEAERSAKIARLDEEISAKQNSVMNAQSGKILASRQVSAPLLSPRVQVTPRQSPAIDVQSLNPPPEASNNALKLGADPMAGCQVVGAGAPVPMNSAMVAVAQLQEQQKQQLTHSLMPANVVASSNAALKASVATSRNISISPPKAHVEIGVDTWTQFDDVAKVASIVKTEIIDVECDDLLNVTEVKGHTDLVLEVKGHNITNKWVDKPLWCKEGQRYSGCYIRGRGRGRYVCERCGIKCRKPSMLQKHMRSHSNMRPFTCNICMISFKTKGNLTKHSKSKAHEKRVAEVGNKSIFKRANNLTCAGKNLLTKQESINSGYNSCEERRLEIDEGATNCAENEDDVTTFASDENDDEISAESDDELYADDNNRCHSVILFNRDRVHIMSAPIRECASAPPVTSYPSTSRICTRKRLSTSARRQLLESIGRRVSEGDDDVMQPAVEACINGRTDIKPPVTLSYPTNSCNELSAFLKADEDKTKCELCAKEFRKTAELRLHMQVHYYEQSTRRYVYPCAHCTTTFRSKSSLLKHTNIAHSNMNSTGALPISPAKDGDPKARNHASSPPLAPQKCNGTNPRPFSCTDCNTAFRIHGHLAKHLRSKLHVMKLEAHGKLPVGTYAKIESSQTSLNEVDTSDYDHALTSLKIIADRLQVDDDVASTSDPGAIHLATPLLPPSPGTSGNTVTQTVLSPQSPSCPVDVVTVTSPSKSTSSNLSPNALICRSSPPPTPSALMCEETMAPSPPPPQGSLQGSLPGAVIVPSCAVTLTPIALPPVAVAQTARPPATECNGIGGPGPGAQNGVNSKFIVADTWIPPTATEIGDVEPAAHADGTDLVLERNGLNTGLTTSRQRLAIPKLEHSKRPSVKQENGVDHQNQTSKCRFCGRVYATVCELNVHLHTDHIAIRDGADFKCPRPNCGKLVPNKTSLRNHVSAHFYGLLPTSNNNSSSQGSTESAGASSSFENRDVDLKDTPATISSKKTVMNAHSNEELVNNGKQNVAHGARTKYRTHLVKLNDIPEAQGSDMRSMPAVDTSPLSDSETSRASSNQSVSPSNITPQILSNGGLTQGRPMFKRRQGDISHNINTSPQQQQQQQQQQQAHAKNRGVSTPDINTNNRRCSSAVDNNVRCGSTPNHQLPSPLARNTPILQQQRPQQFNIGGDNSAWMLASLYPNMLNIGQNGGQIHPALLAAAYGFSNVTNQGQPTPHASTPTHNAFTNGQAHNTELPCALCGRRFESPILLQEHLLSHVTERPWVCDRCDAGFTNENALRMHLQTHSHNNNNDNTPRKTVQKHLNI